MFKSGFEKVAKEKKANRPMPVRVAMGVGGGALLAAGLIGLRRVLKKG